MTVLQAILGALMRRWWGGWLHPNNAVKRAVVPSVAIAVGLLHYGLSWCVPVIAGYVAFCFLMPKHGYAIQMGRDPRHPLLACLLISFAQYGVSAIAMSAVMWYGFHVVYIPFGVFVTPVWWAAWKVWDWKQYNIGGFIDGPGAIAEFAIGASLLGGIYGMA